MSEESLVALMIGRPLQVAFPTREGAERPIDEAEWQDAIVVVESGEIDLEGLGSGRCTFQRGDVLWLSGPSLRVLHNRGSGPAVLIAVSRKNGDEFSADPPS